MIEVTNLSKHYKQGKNVVRALDGVSLDIEQGEFVAVVGRSGSGKTTMLDSLGLLLKPTSGAVVIDGVDTSRLKDDQKARLRGDKIGFIFQEYNLLPTLTAIENVMLPLRYAAKPKGDRKWAQALLEEVGLADRVSSRPDQLSGGQQQRIAIARSLVNRPSMVLGDEPTGAVDTETSDQLAAIMRRMNVQHQVTFVIVTHDLDLAAKTDRIVRLKDGKVVSDETTAPEQVAV
ncbi:MAG TPA: ABC transporter ATP-binding protein [Candidatus Dormibacteraeota bacterium]|nr:ABC transporter ATP-binding protein [Candidatus Dormibacteraeota bacterium]HEX2680520.1 ABC transporter ATP-binding protein [Candidatus Dormibacteraeota bacterium]